MSVLILLIVDLFNLLSLDSFTLLNPTRQGLTILCLISTVSWEGDNMDEDRDVEIATDVDIEREATPEPEAENSDREESEISSGEEYETDEDNTGPKRSYRQVRSFIYSCLRIFIPLRRFDARDRKP